VLKLFELIKIPQSKYVHTFLKQGLSIIEILVAISLIAIAMLGVSSYIQTQNMSSMNLSISAKNISAQRYLEKLIWAKYIEVPGADSNCQFITNVSNAVTQIGLSPNKQCSQSKSDLDSATVLANVYPLTCDLSSVALSCRTTPLNTAQSALAKNALQSVPALGSEMGPADIKCQTIAQAQNNDTEVIIANCPLENVNISPSLPSYLLIFQGILKDPRSDGVIKYYYPAIYYQNSSS
jgi:prepilin-type N-terminal cleavage/methylation domain-containing protein